MFDAWLTLLTTIVTNLQLKAYFADASRVTFSAESIESQHVHSAPFPSV